MERDPELPDQREWIESLSRRPRVKGIDVLAILDAVRAERENELDYPVVVDPSGPGRASSAE